MDSEEEEEVDLEEEEAEIEEAEVVDLEVEEVETEEVSEEEEVFDFIWINIAIKYLYSLPSCSQSLLSYFLYCNISITCSFVFLRKSIDPSRFS